MSGPDTGSAYFDLLWDNVMPPSAKSVGTKDDLHPWAGITRFKEGFGGRLVSSPGAYDLPLNKLGYFLYTAVRKLR
jgi:hypothetical protein